MASLERFVAKSLERERGLRESFSKKSVTKNLQKKKQRKKKERGIEMAPPTNRTPAAQNFLRKYDRLSAAIFVIAGSMYAAEYYINTISKKKTEKEVTMANPNK